MALSDFTRPLPHSQRNADLLLRRSDFTDAEVVEALRHLVREGLVEILVFDSQCNQLAPSASTPNFEGALEEYWFRLNDAGRTKWEQWEPPREPM